MSLNLNWDGKLEDEGPQPPSGLSMIAGSEKDAILYVAVAVHSEEKIHARVRVESDRRASHVATGALEVQPLDRDSHEVCTILPTISMSVLTLRQCGARDQQDKRA